MNNKTQIILVRADYRFPYSSSLSRLMHAASIRRAPCLFVARGRDFCSARQAYL